MTLRSILVCLNSSASVENLLTSAALLARRDNAHVIGLFVKQSLVIYPGVAMYIPETSFSGFAANQMAHANEVKAAFDAKTTAEIFSSEWRLDKAQGGSLADHIIAQARGADVIMMAQEDGDNGVDFQERVIKESGRPVLVIPNDYTAKTLGEAVLLGWSDTREATRVGHDLLDVADAQANIRMLRVGKPPSDTLADHSANDMATALARHGPQIEIVHRDQNSSKISDILLHEAFDMGADMIATGAFGHSRAYDFVIGAATRAILSDAKLPVLFSK